MTSAPLHPRLWTNEPDTVHLFRRRRQSLSELRDMQQFFADRADTWEHFVKVAWLPNAYEYYYSLIASQVAPTDEPIRILDLGCGGGIEFEWIFARAPNAQITGVDQSAAMLANLRRKFEDRLHQFTLTQESYLTCALEEAAFDYAITSMSVHYFRPGIRREIYQRIFQAIKPLGLYIEGTYSAADLKEEKEVLDYFETVTAGQDDVDTGRFKVNVPLYPGTVSDLLLQVGFTDVTWPEDGDMVAVASKPA